MIVITGAAGFIGSSVATFFNDKGITDLLLVDDFDSPAKAHNWEPLEFEFQIKRQSFIDWFKENPSQVDFMIHLGARTDTTEFDYAIFQELNVDYSKAIWQICAEHNIPLVYASSAATYGDGELGFDDDESTIDQLEPLNPYGRSKQEFDIWALQQKKKPPFWAGLKFFNVYGPNEYHKGRMASVVFHAFNKISETGVMSLFRSHNPDYKDGEQQRDLIYVKDISKVIYFLYTEKPQSGIYNLGAGQARTFNDLVTAVFKVLGKEPNISYIDTPIDIRDKYQYFTEANMDKLRASGYVEEFTSLEEGVTDYVKEHLIPWQAFTKAHQ